MRKHYRDKILALMKDEIIYVLLKHAHEKGRDEWISTSHIGKKIGTYRKDDPLSGETLGRKHKPLLRKLKEEGRVEHALRVGWRLSDAEYNRLTQSIPEDFLKKG